MDYFNFAAGLARAQCAYDNTSAPDKLRASGKATVELAIEVEVEIDNGRLLDAVPADDDYDSGPVARWLMRNYKRELLSGAEAAIEKGRAS